MNAGDYWPRDRRYGVMTVEGYFSLESSTYTFSFWVVDTHLLCMEIQNFRGGGRTLDAKKVQAARTRAVALCDRLNEREALIASL